MSWGIKGSPEQTQIFTPPNLMNAVLGGSAGIARLFGRVRDVQGLAYSVWSSFTPSIGEGLFHASAGVNPANVDKAINSILHEIELMKSDGITEEELSDAQNLIVGNFAPCSRNKQRSGRSSPVRGIVRIGTRLS